MDTDNVAPPGSNFYATNSVLNWVSGDQYCIYHKGAQPIRRIAYGAKILPRRIAENRRQEVDRWPDPTPNHRDACKKRLLSTTGVWFLETAQYNKWKMGLEPFLLWLYGKRMFLPFELLVSKLERQRDAARLS